MQPLSKNQLKFFSSLKIKKNRDEENLFVAEGEKLAGEILDFGKNIHSVVATEAWLLRNHKIVKNSNFNLYKATDEDLSRISQLKTPNNVVVIMHQWKGHALNKEKLPDLTLILDDIQDPGNLGTIIRLADWFGIKNIICSHATADFFNSKVIQSTMGAFLRINIIYADITEYLNNIKKTQNIQVYGAFLQGKNIYESELKSPAFIVMGNESKGISSAVEIIVDQKITIPSYNQSAEKTESLNVATATAIICAEFRRVLS